MAMVSSDIVWTTKRQYIIDEAARDNQNQSNMIAKNVETLIKQEKLIRHILS